MKRDMDLIRQILFRLEACTSARWDGVFVVDGYEKSVVGYHLHLLNDAGFIRISDTSSSAGRSAEPLYMTWAGHEFLDAARSDTIWKKAKEKIGSTLGTVSMAVLESLLTGMAKERLGL